MECGLVCDDEFGWLDFVVIGFSFWGRFRIGRLLDFFLFELSYLVNLRVN